MNSGLKSRLERFKKQNDYLLNKVIIEALKPYYTRFEIKANNVMVCVFNAKNGNERTFIKERWALQKIIFEDKLKNFYGFDYKIVFLEQKFKKIRFYKPESNGNFNNNAKNPAIYKAFEALKETLKANWAIWNDLANNPRYKIISKGIDFDKREFVDCLDLESAYFEKK